MPNLHAVPGASLVGAVAAGHPGFARPGSARARGGGLATIGMTIYWVIFYGALLQGMWWWFLPPIIVVVILFIGLFGLSAGLDEWANPRLRKTV